MPDTAHPRPTNAADTQHLYVKKKESVTTVPKRENTDLPRKFRCSAYSDRNTKSQILRRTAKTWLLSPFYSPTSLGKSGDPAITGVPGCNCPHDSPSPMAAGISHPTR